MKVIDLLNKIANGEEVPKKIKYEDIVYNWDDYGYLHYRDSLPERAFLEGLRTDMVLNTYVEVIEDEEIDIDSIEELEIYDKDEKFYSPIIIDNRIKINELIKAVKQLNKKIKEKE